MLFSGDCFPPTPHNAKKVRSCTFVLLICTGPYTPPLYITHGSLEYALLILVTQDFNEYVRVICECFRSYLQGFIRGYQFLDYTDFQISPKHVN